MSGVWAFVISILVAGVLAVWMTVGAPSKWREYFGTPGGRKILAGIIVFVGAGLLAALMSAPAKAGDLKWFDYGEVYLGLDYTNRSPSPQCVGDPGGADERLTSNGGARVNIVSWPDDSFQANLKYTHHSCAVNTDRNTYDGMGVELVYRLW
jgi:hypothetical protein